MLIKETYTGKSPIHGIGLFSKNKLVKGEPLWSYSPSIDIRIEQNQIPIDLRDHFDKFSTISKFVERILLRTGYQNITHEDILIYNYRGDNCKFMNHSEDPNIGFNAEIGIALKDIDENEELTCDYRTITTPEHFEFLMLQSENINTDNES